jgi:hypothetical protein
MFHDQGLAEHKGLGNAIEVGATGRIGARLISRTLIDRLTVVNSEWLRAHVKLTPTALRVELEVRPAENVDGAAGLEKVTASD